MSDQAELIACDNVVFAVGHSARGLYQNLVELGVEVEAKPIAVGFRIEHPQEAINRIQYVGRGARIYMDRLSPPVQVPK